VYRFRGILSSSGVMLTTLEPKFNLV
jgi:hypothetical protein